MRRAALATIVVIAGGLLAAAIPSSGAGPQMATLGSVTGTPSTNVCFAGCTFVPFTNVANPTLQVPFDGTVTSFSINTGSASGFARLRVLRPAGGGQYTAVASSPAEPIANTGLTTFTVSVPVKTGDVLGLDNDTSALLFDNSDLAPITAYYQSDLADGATAAPNGTRMGVRLLMSAVVQATTTTTTTGTTGGGGGGKTPAPVLTRVHESHRMWRENRKRRSAGTPKPVGTTFSFTLSAKAQVSFTFRRKLRGGRTKTEGKRSFSGRQGKNAVAFRGQITAKKRLPTGRHTLRITATANGATSPVAQLSFTIVR